MSSKEAKYLLALMLKWDMEDLQISINKSILEQCFFASDWKFSKVV